MTAPPADSPTLEHEQPDRDSQTGSISKYRRLLVVATILGVLACAGFGVFYWSLFRHGKSLAVIVDPFLASMESGDYVRAAELAGAEGRDENVAGFRALGEYFNPILGRFESKRLVGVECRKERERSMTTLQYEAKYENHTVQLEFVVQNKGGELEIWEFSYASDDLPLFEGWQPDQ